MRLLTLEENLVVARALILLPADDPGRKVAWNLYRELSDSPGIAIRQIDAEHGGR